MKEIGGYFGLDNLVCNGGEYYPNLIALNTARNALTYLAKAGKVKKVQIPYLLCDSVSKVCDREGIPYTYYHTDNYFLPILNHELAEGEFLYLENLYGQISNEKVAEYRKQFGRIIVDNIHAFFQKPLDGIDIIYSCRKFFGVPDGAYLATDCKLKEELPIDYSENRLAHIYGRVRDGASAHYAEFKANDESFKQLPLMQMSETTHKMLSVLDYERIKKIREDNFLYLYEKLGCRNRLNLRIPEGPYAYPFYCENGLEVRKKLAERKIYVATLWPNVLEEKGTVEKEFAENILPLPCDQRYGKDDMDIMIEILL